MWSVTRWGILALAVATLSASAASATVLVGDDFEGYGAATVLNFTGFTGLSVEQGAVDLIAMPNGYGLSTPTGHGFIDLDGSINEGGLLQTPTFSFKAGDIVTLEFDASGNQRGGSRDLLDYGFGGGAFDIYDQLFRDPLAVGEKRGPNVGLSRAFRSPFLAPDLGWGHYLYQATVLNDSEFYAFLSTESADNAGPLIDNFKLTVTPGVPEPAVWTLLLTGFGSVGAMLRGHGRRARRYAAARTRAPGPPRR